MISKETFCKICNIVLYTDDRCDAFSSDLERVFNKPFLNVGESDNTVMITWPFEAVCSILKELLLELGESEEGVDWFIYDGMRQITKEGGTEIDDKRIQSFADYYDYLTSN